MDLTKTDLNLLVAFEALAEARSVSGAAEAIGLRQPAMSAALARLRRLFGDELFVRVGRQMQPTPKAQRLIPAVALALAQVRAALGEEVPFDPPTAQRTFALGVTDYAAAVLGPPLVEAVRREAPGVDLRLLSYAKDEAGALIERGVFDLAIGVFADPPERCVVSPIAGERFVGVVRSGHRALAPSLDATTFAALDHALYTNRKDDVGAIDHALAELGLRRRVVLTTPHLLALPDMLVRADLVAAIPSLAAERLCGDELETFAIPLVLEDWTLQMLWSPTSRTDRGAAWIRRQVVAAGRSGARGQG